MNIEVQSITFKKDLHISDLCSVHYFEFSRNYVFPGEKHDFWELVYVDKGELLATAESEEFPIGSGEMLFHAPNEWHNLRANGVTAANVMILSFRCRSKAMEAFVGRRLRPDSRQRELLRDILKESRQAFCTRLDDPYDNTLQRAKDAPLGSEQLIGIYLTQLLISMLRQLEHPSGVDKKSGSVPMLDAMIAYMEQNLSRKLSLEQLAAEFHVSTSYIKRLFSQYKQTGAMGYFTMLKIEQAKQLLRESDRNISQIAELLGYDNIYYFCNQFKKHTGMSPLEYRRSVNAMGERARLV